jgi:hypothetical protein
VIGITKSSKFKGAFKRARSLASARCHEEIAYGEQQSPIGYNWQHGNFVLGWEADISGHTNEGKLRVRHSCRRRSVAEHRAGLAVRDTMA